MLVVEARARFTAELVRGQWLLHAVVTPAASLVRRRRFCDAALPQLPVWLSWPANQGRDASAVVASMLAFTDHSLK